MSDIDKTKIEKGAQKAPSQSFLARAMTGMIIGPLVAVPYLSLLASIWGFSIRTIVEIWKWSWNFFYIG